MCVCVCGGRGWDGEQCPKSGFPTLTFPQKLGMCKEAGFYSKDPFFCVSKAFFLHVDRPKISKRRQPQFCFVKLFYLLKLHTFTSAE